MHALSTAPLATRGQAGRGSWWARLVRAVVREYEARRTLRELELLENYMLRDIGLDRGGLEHAARFGRPRHPAA